MKTTLLLSSALTMMAGATIAPALPAMRVYFADAPNVDLLVRLVLTLPGLFIAVAAPLAGAIVDRWGRTRLLAAAIVLYGIAGSSGYLMDSLAGLLVSRAGLGIAVAALMTCVTTLIADYFEGQERAGFMGLQASFMNLGGVGILIGGGLLAGIGWRVPFLVYLSAFAILPFVLLTLHEPERPARPSAVSPDGLSLRAVNTPIGALLLVYVTTLISMIIFYMVPSQIPFHLATLTGAGPGQTGIAIATTTLFAAVSAALYGRVSNRLNRNYLRITAVAFAIMGIGYLIIAQAGTLAGVMAGLAVAGLGLGLTFPNFSVWLSATAPEALRGRALGGLTTSVFLGQFLSPFFSQPMVPIVGLSATFAIASALLVVLALIYAAATLRRAR